MASKKTMAIEKANKPLKADPVLPDQGGRMTSLDPARPTALVSEEAVRVRAYYIYEERGKREGNALDDWLKAQSQVAGSDE